MRRVQFALFFGVIIGILAGAHAIVYFSILHFFGLAGDAKKMLFLATVFLATSFLISSILAHWYDTIFTRGFYFLSATWLGVLSNACFIFIGAWVAIYGMGFFGVPLSSVWMGGIAVILALLVSGYGLYNANNPIVRHETVYIRNLPIAWEGKRIVQISDVHIGHILRDEFTTRLASLIDAENPAIVVIVGDLFDGMDGHLEALVKPLENIQSTYGTYFITGNHETYLGTRNVSKALTNSNIKTIDDMLLNLDGLQFIGLSWVDQARDIGEIFSRLGYDGAVPSVVLYHAPTGIETMKSLWVSLQLAGHTHRGQLYPYNLITHRLFKGYDFGLYREGDYTLSTSSGVGTWGPPMRTNAHPEIVVLTLRESL